MLGADRAYTRDLLLPSAGAIALEPEQVREVGPDPVLGFTAFDLLCVIMNDNHW
jgi:hypothetical protein